MPSHYDTPHHRRALAGYVGDYLKEEVLDEGLTRNAPAFARFFDALTFCQGELVNYSNIARDCGVSSKTVREYFQILVDTFLGVLVEPFRKRRSRAVITSAPRFTSSMWGWPIMWPAGGLSRRADRISAVRWSTSS